MYFFPHPKSQAQFGTGRSESFSFANVELNLRDTPDVDANVCDIGTLTIWGREPPEEDGGEPGEPRVFAQIEIPASIFVSLCNILQLSVLCTGALYRLTTMLQLWRMTISFSA